MNRYMFVFLTSLILLFISACGHKGRLYLPEQAPKGHKVHKDLINPIPEQ